MTEKIPEHPGEVLRRDFMAPRKLTAEQLDDALAVRPGLIQAILDRKNRITGPVSYRLGRYFKCDPDYWVNLQHEWTEYNKPPPTIEQLDEADFDVWFEKHEYEVRMRGGELDMFLARASWLEARKSLRLKQCSS